MDLSGYFNVDIGAWDVSRITSMAAMFRVKVSLIVHYPRGTYQGLKISTEC